MLWRIAKSPLRAQPVFGIKPKYRSIMTTFADPNFSHTGYASARPSYPQKLYDLVLKYHQGPRNSCLDLGTGHGLVARALADRFTSIVATDPSEGMLKQAVAMTPADCTNVSFELGTSEAVATTIEPGSVDMVVAAQAAHWFDYDKTWPELFRILRPGGTIAFWGYSDVVCPENPKAAAIMHSYSYGEDALRPYWTLPGRAIVENYYRDIVPSSQYFTGHERFEYVPGTKGLNSGTGEKLMGKKSTVKDLMSYIRTWSAVHKWQQANPAEKRDREGDIIDWMFEEIAQQDPVFADSKNEFELEWGTGLVLARRK